MIVKCDVNLYFRSSTCYSKVASNTIVQILTEGRINKATQFEVK